MWIWPAGWLVHWSDRRSAVSSRWRRSRRKLVNVIFPREEATIFPTDWAPQNAQASAQRWCWQDLHRRQRSPQDGSVRVTPLNAVAIILANLSSASTPHPRRLSLRTEGRYRHPRPQSIRLSRTSIHHHHSVSDSFTNKQASTHTRITKLARGRCTCCNPEGLVCVW